MEAVEFQTKVKNGTIEIPDIYQPALAEGVQVKVIVLKQPRKALIQDFKDLLKETQSLPQAQSITEAEITAEIEAYRAGQ
jgi:hypothetical protein